MNSSVVAYVNDIEFLSILEHVGLNPVIISYITWISLSQPWLTQEDAILLCAYQPLRKLSSGVHRRQMTSCPPSSDGKSMQKAFKSANRRKAKPPKQLRPSSAASLNPSPALASQISQSNILTFLLSAQPQMKRRNESQVHWAVLCLAAALP